MGCFEFKIIFGVWVISMEYYGYVVICGCFIEVDVMKFIEFVDKICGVYSVYVSIVNG